MAHGLGEDPSRSVGELLTTVDYPVDREELVASAADSESPAEVINLLKSLPRERYESHEMVLRDLGEAARRFGMNGHAPPGRHPRSAEPRPRRGGEQPRRKHPPPLSRDLQRRSLGATVL